MRVVEIDAGQAPVVHHRAARDMERDDMSGHRARKQKIDRRDRHDRIAVETVDVEHERGSGLATSRSFQGAGGVSLGDTRKQ